MTQMGIENTIDGCVRTMRRHTKCLVFGVLFRCQHIMPCWCHAIARAVANRQLFKPTHCTKKKNLHCLGRAVKVTFPLSSETYPVSLFAAKKAQSCPYQAWQDAKCKQGVKYKHGVKSKQGYPDKKKKKVWKLRLYLYQHPNIWHGPLVKTQVSMSNSAAV